MFGMRLTGRQDNGITGIKTTWTYDAGGNIIQKRSLNGTSEVSKTTYAYRTSGWKDQLLSISEGGATYAFAYDGCGNPTQYKSTAQNMWWTRGRMLERYKSGSTDVSYKYDLNGNRVAKTVLENGETTEYKYYTEDGTVLREERKTGGVTQSLRYLFGTDGLIGFRYGNTEYYYRRRYRRDIRRGGEPEGRIPVRSVRRK